MLLSLEDRQKEEEALRERYRDKCTPEKLEAFVEQLVTSRVIHAKRTWAASDDGIEKKACIVRDWEVVNIIAADEPMKLLYSDNVISDYKFRFMPGEYVFSSLIIHFDEETGLVQTRNSLYCLDGDGEEVNATLREAYNMRSLGQSLHVLRNVEGNLGPNSAIIGPESDD